MLTFYIEDQAHDRIRHFVDDPVNSFLQFARLRAAVGTKILDAINPYADTMLNFIQLDRLIVELREALAGECIADAQREKVEEVLEGATEARLLSGYLFIEGD